MTGQTEQRPSLPGGEGAPGGDQDHSGVEGAKNIRIKAGRPKLMNLCTYNLRTMSTESGLLALLEKLSSIKWDVVGLSEVRRLGEYGMMDTCSFGEETGISHSDEEIESFYEDVHLASERVKTHFTIIMGDFNTEISKKTGETVVGNHGTV
ncbi:uncharacterized protein [Penaeus vannamei]|uniref:uncharacterized protein n=1 Tax=Penaeus vannamei TaxID=6689 RepID=UPI00387F5A2A